MGGMSNYMGMSPSPYQSQMYQPQMPTYMQQPTYFGRGAAYGGIHGIASPHFFGGYQSMNPYMGDNYMAMGQPDYWNRMAYSMARPPSYLIPRAGNYYTQPAPAQPGYSGTQSINDRSQMINARFPRYA